MSRVPPLRFIEPQLASLVDEPPEGKHWIHEIKYDGYRSQVLIAHGVAGSLPVRAAHHRLGSACPEEAG